MPAPPSAIEPGPSDAKLADRLRRLHPERLARWAMDHAFEGDLPSCQLALAAGLDPRLCADQNGSSLLMMAAASGSRELVELLIPLSSPKALNAFGQNALLHAAMSAKASAILPLIPVSDVDQLDRQGCSALALALAHRAETPALEALADASDLSFKTPTGEGLDQLEERWMGESYRGVRDRMALACALAEREALLCSPGLPCARAPRI